MQAQVLNENYPHILRFQWTETWQERLNSTVLEILLVLDWSAHSLKVTKLKIPLADSWSGLVATRGFGKEDRPDFYYESLVCADLIRERHKTKKYEESMMKVTAETFAKWAKELLRKVTNKHGADHKTPIIHCAFSAMRYFSFFKYLPESNTPKSKRRKSTK